MFGELHGRVTQEQRIAPSAPSGAACASRHVFHGFRGALSRVRWGASFAFFRTSNWSLSRSAIRRLIAAASAAMVGRALYCDSLRPSVPKRVTYRPATGDRRQLWLYHSRPPRRRSPPWLEAWIRQPGPAGARAQVPVDSIGRSGGRLRSGSDWAAAALPATEFRARLQSLSRSTRWYPFESSPALLIMSCLPGLPCATGTQVNMSKRLHRKGFRGPANPAGAVDAVAHYSAFLKNTADGDAALPAMA
jgi:hypothetical protein